MALLDDSAGREPAGPFVFTVAVTTAPFAKLHPLSRIPELERRSWLIGGGGGCPFGAQWERMAQEGLLLASERVGLYGPVSVSSGRECELANACRAEAFARLECVAQARLRKPSEPMCAGFGGGFDVLPGQVGFLGMELYVADQDTRWLDLAMGRAFGRENAKAWLSLEVNWANARKALTPEPSAQWDGWARRCAGFCASRLLGEQLALCCAEGGKRGEGSRSI